MDWNLQKCKEKVELVSSYNIPAWVMEPVRGEKLAKLPEADGQTANPFVQVVFAI